jgi:hypothetical protein
MLLCTEILDWCALQLVAQYISCSATVLDWPTHPLRISFFYLALLARTISLGRVLVRLHSSPSKKQAISEHQTRSAALCVRNIVVGHSLDQVGGMFGKEDCYVDARKGE